MRKTLTVVWSAVALLAGCIAASSGASDKLGNTTWRLVELRSSDDAIGAAHPDNPSKYEMRLGADGRATLRLDCNRGAGRWKSGAPNRITFTPLAMTRAMCPPGSLDTRIARELGYVRTYILEGDRLRLIMMADGGSQLWTRSGG